MSVWRAAHKVRDRDSGDILLGPMASRNKSHRERFRRCLQVFLTQLFSHVGLCALVVAYSIGGAFLFELLEAERELDQRREIQRSRENCLADLWYLSGNLTARQWSNWTSAAGALLKEFENHVVTATKLDGYDGKEASDSERQWSFSGSLLYSITVITTIGYGNLAPRTAAGKLVTMLYALIGIPVMLLFLSNIGTSMAGAFQFAFAELSCSLQCCRAKSRHRPHDPPVADPPADGQDNRPEEEIISQKVSPVVRWQRRRLKSRDYIDVRELAKFDYDVVDPPSSGTTPGHLSGEEHRRAAVISYGLERLNAPAKCLVAECAQYQSDSCRPIVVRHPPTSFGQIGRLLSQMEPLNAADSNVAAIDDPQGQHQQHPTVKVSADSAAARINATQLLGRLSIDGSAVRMPADTSLAINGPDRDGQPADGRRWSEKRRVPVLIVLTFLVGYICVGAVVFSTWEEWSFLDGAYFSFITLSTIGFGDLVPGSNVLSADTHEGQYKLVICCLYLVLGLAIIAMSFNLVQEEVVARFQRLGHELGILDEK